MDRIYKHIIASHLENDRQMVFLAGPRQVGKTTVSKTAESLTDHFVYLNWDFQDDQQLILQGPKAVADEYGLNQPHARKSILTLDEIHKLKNWRNYLKGFYDKYSELVRFVVTGSSKLDVYRNPGDSLMGRYFPYRVHPLSVRELIDTDLVDVELRQPTELPFDVFESLVEFGGFPEPFFKQNKAFYRRWVKLRMEQLFHLDIRDLTRIHEIAQMKLLATILQNQICDPANYSAFATLANVSSNTISVWIDTLRSFYYCFRVTPWAKNIVRSLVKQPKIYLWNWADTEDKGARHENMVAAHLLKAIHLWEDRGLGEYGLYYLRDKDKREVDFLVTKNKEPWFLVEVKSSNNQSISEHLYYFQQQTKAPHAFQLVFNLPYQEIDCFSYNQPVIVPAITFLSQLV